MEDVVLLPETPADILIRQSSLSSTLSLPLSPNRTRAQISPILSPEKEMKIHENDKYSAQLIATIYKKVGLLDALTPIVKYTPSKFLYYKALKL